MPTTRSSRTRKVLFCLLPVGLLGLAGGLLSFDLFLHRKFDKISAPNRAGYRGPIVGKKEPGEVRVFLLGGSTAGGYGVYPWETVAAQLENLLNQDAGPGRKFSVVNLGQNSTGAAAFIHDLKHYESLDYDIAIFFEGYDDLGTNKSLGRYENPIFRLTGYYPIAPLILSEKAHVLRYGSALDKGELGGKKIFRAKLSNAGASVMETLAKAGESVEKTLAKFSKKTAENQDTAPMTDCGRWTHYCDGMLKGVNYALAAGKKVIVATEPYVSPEHFDQQRVLGAVVRTLYMDKTDLQYLNLGELLDTKDRKYTLDGVHFTKLGCALVAEQLKRPVLQAALAQNVGKAR